MTTKKRLREIQLNDAAGNLSSFILWMSHSGLSSWTRFSEDKLDLFMRIEFELINGGLNYFIPVIDTRKIKKVGKACRKDALDKLLVTELAEELCRVAGNLDSFAESLLTHFVGDKHVDVVPLEDGIIWPLDPEEGEE